MEPHLPHFVAFLHDLNVVKCFTYLLQFPTQIPFALNQSRSVEPDSFVLVRALTAQITLFESDEILLLIILLDFIDQSFYFYLHLLDSPCGLLVQQVVESQFGNQLVHLQGYVKRLWFDLVQFADHTPMFTILFLLFPCWILILLLLALVSPYSLICELVDYLQRFQNALRMRAYCKVRFSLSLI